MTLTGGNKRPGVTKLENTITSHIRLDNKVFVEIKPTYNGNSLIPDSINIYAIDQDVNVIVDANVGNGLRGSTKCCIN